MMSFRYKTTDGTDETVDVMPAAISAWEIDTRQKAGALARDGFGITDCIQLAYRQLYPASKAGAPTLEVWAESLTEIIPVFGDPT